MKYTNTIAAMLLAAALVGCGGGGSSGKKNPPAADPGGGTTPPPVNTDGRGANAGRFVDAPVQGLRYVAGPSQNACAEPEAGCVTDADGTFRYNPGDRVTFYLGGVELGQVVARSVVTPHLVAQAVAGEGASDADVQNIRENLLVFLQSFDADGNPDNGITVTPVIADAVEKAGVPIDFKAPATDFDATMDGLVSEVQLKEDVPATVKRRDRAEAIAHYQRSLEENIAGTYAWSNAKGVIDPGNPVRTLTLFRSGTFLFAGYENDASCAELGSDPMGNGIVTGTYVYDAEAGTLDITRASDLVHTTGDCGIGTGVYDVQSFDGTLLALKERDSSEPEFYFSRVEQSTRTVAGSWLLPDSVLRPTPEPVVVTFFPTSADGKQGRYILADARAENGRGMEYGCYAIAANGSASFNAQSGGTCVNVADTNGQDGFHNISAKWFGVDAYGRLVLIEKDGDGSDLVVAFMPLNGGRVDIAHLGGAWYLETELRANPEEKSEMFVLWVDGDSGEFVFGTQHEPTGSSADPNECWTTFYSDNRYGAYEAYGNGVETGFLREREGWKGMGIVRPAIDPDKGGLDTNGDCGMHNVDTTPGNDLFLFRPSPTDPDVLLGWESGESESFSFRRVTSKANSLVGAWKHYDDFDDSIPELSVFFPGGQFFHIMYDANSDTIDQGVRRERWVFRGQAPQLGFTTEGFAYCADTIDDTPADPDGYCAESGTRWDEVEFNPERTEGTHDKGFMRKITQP